MIRQLRDKKVIFFDVGYTLDRPASGDWMFTNRFLAEAGDRLKACTDHEIARAREAGLRYLTGNHLVRSVEAECDQFYRYYSILSEELALSQIHEAARQIVIGLGTGDQEGDSLENCHGAQRYDHGLAIERDGHDTVKAAKSDTDQNSKQYCGKNTHDTVGEEFCHQDRRDRHLIPDGQIAAAGNHNHENTGGTDSDVHILHKDVGQIQRCKEPVGENAENNHQQNKQNRH